MMKTRILLVVAASLGILSLNFVTTLNAVELGAVTSCIKDDNAMLTAIAGGLIGGILGVLGTLASSYYGPRKLEEWREQRLEQRINGPRKGLLRQMLSDRRFEEGRSLETLCKVTGTTAAACRSILIEIQARGFTLKDGREGWTFIENRPLNDV
jgi:hypothetical protein